MNTCEKIDYIITALYCTGIYSCGLLANYIITIYIPGTSIAADSTIGSRPVFLCDSSYKSWSPLVWSGCIVWIPICSLPLSTSIPTCHLRDNADNKYSKLTNWVNYLVIPYPFWYYGAISVPFHGVGICDYRVKVQFRGPKLYK